MRGRTAVATALILGMLSFGVGPARVLASTSHPTWRPAEATPARVEGAPSAVAVDLHLSDAGGVARLVFDLTDKVAVTSVLTEKPDRLVIDLPEVDFRIDPALGRAELHRTGLIRAFRFGLFARGRSRIVLDLAEPATLRRVDVASIAGGAPSRLSIELARTDRATFHAKALQPAPEPAAGVPASTQSGDTRPVVVIDPGHGGIDPGASGAGAIEKDVVLGFATALAQKLSSGGRYRVVLTRNDDSFVSLGERVRIARDADAALLISVHADTLSDRSVTGATVYTASDQASDAEAARLAATENQADEAAGLAPGSKQTGVSDILFDLARRETRTYAHQFQRTLTGYWAKTARLNRNPDRAAGFKVLQAPDVPSVLLELGYLSNERDVQSLTSGEWRDRAAGSIAGAVDAFFATRTRPSGTGAAADLR